MTAYIAVAFAALLASGLTLYSGFGLGTLLLPVFALFFPVEVAVVATALVHGANNVFKVSLLGRYADWQVVIRFGVTAVISAVAGAMLLGSLAVMEQQLTWRLGDMLGQTTPLKLTIGLLMLLFAVIELSPRFKKLEFDRKWLPLGGVISGFFGGLSGHQGAMRSAFLVKSGLTTEAFVGTSCVVGLMVDAIRIAAYLGLVAWAGEIAWPELSPSLVVTGVLAAFAGVLVGKRYLHKVRMRWVQILTGMLLLVIAVLLGSGLI